jgi:hypothetical protein
MKSDAEWSEALNFRELDFTAMVFAPYLSLSKLTIRKVFFSSIRITLPCRLSNSKSFVSLDRCEIVARAVRNV